MNGTAPEAGPSGPVASVAAVPEAAQGSGVRTYWHDPKRAKRRSVLIGKSGNAKRLKESHASEADARSAAQAEWQRIQRGAATFELTLALGRPEVMPQSPVSVTGFKAQINAAAWLVMKTTHSLGDAGFTTRLEMETAGAEAAESSSAQDVDDTP